MLALILFESWRLRSLRVEFPGAIYHVTDRMVGSWRDERLMQKLTTGYALYFNRRHGRHGHLFDGCYKAKVVEGDEYLLKLSHYVHLNPVHVAG